MNKINNQNLLDIYKELDKVDNTTILYNTSVLNHIKDNLHYVNAIKEDITFEIPKLTQNLENFKKKLEEEIQKEDNAQIRKTTGLTLNKDQKSIKILDRTQIERTTLIPVIKNVEKIEQETKVKKTQKNNDDF